MAFLCTCCRMEVEQERLSRGKESASKLEDHLRPLCNRRCPNCGAEIRCDGKGHNCP